jgi:hypothetical protein
MDQVLTMLQAMSVLGWLPDLTLIEWLQWLLIVVVASVPVDMLAARRLFWGFAAATHIDKVRRATGGMTTLQWLLCWDSGIATALLDVYCQVSFTKYFWDIPREVTLSKRLTRYLEGPDCRNKRIAEAVRDQTKIDSFDWRGKHL